MNEKLKQLAIECNAWEQVYDNKRFMVDRNFDVEKFAELIIKECADVATINQYQHGVVGLYVKKHFYGS
jgi:hypothetical protein